jgi:hypothetical protein
VPTSKRPQVDDVQYLRIPSRILKGVSNEEVVNYVVVEVAMLGLVDDEACEIMSILNVWSIDTPRYLA